MKVAKFGFGQSVERKEDDPLLRGRGRYIADAAPGSMLHVSKNAKATKGLADKGMAPG